ncbi:MAG: prolipoprotein diacylglyceryl transferase [Planctomycetes bacterium]|nr:prolipoprotein diacylglyceryl transferase [Planctomycetota bacterium]
MTLPLAQAVVPATLAAWLHDLSPFIIEVGNGWGLRWYGTAYAAGFVVAWFLLRNLSRRGVTPLSEQRLTDAMVALCMGVVIGGRLGYAIFYEPRLFVTISDSFPWWGLLQINKGGMASHGGMVGVTIACYVIARGVKGPDGKRTGAVPMLHVMDLTAYAATPGLFFGRLANFVNGELLGKIVAAPGEPGPWWSVRYPQELLSDQAPALTRPQELGLAKLLSQFRLPNQGDAGALDRALHVLRSGPRAEAAKVAEQLTPLLSARHPSQLYQAAAEGLALGLILVVMWRGQRRAGTIAAMFLMVYGVLRILTELYRLPDAHLAVQRIMGLSRGQWLSVGMILCGAGLMGYAMARKTARFGPTTA